MTDRKTVRLLCKQPSVGHVQEMGLCPGNKGAVLMFEGADPVVRLVAQNLTYAATSCGRLG